MRSSIAHSSLLYIILLSTIFGIGYGHPNQNQSIAIVKRAKTLPPLYNTETNKPHYEDIKQDFVDNCWLIAALKETAYKDPGRLTWMLPADATGPIYDVTVSGCGTVKVDARDMFHRVETAFRQATVRVRRQGPIWGEIIGTALRTAHPHESRKGQHLDTPLKWIYSSGIWHVLAILPKRKWWQLRPKPVPVAQQYIDDVLDEQRLKLCPTLISFLYSEGPVINNHAYALRRVTDNGVEIGNPHGYSEYITLDRDFLDKYTEEISQAQLDIWDYVKGQAIGKQLGSATDGDPSTGPSVDLGNAHTDNLEADGLPAENADDLPATEPLPVNVRKPAAELHQPAAERGSIPEPHSCIKASVVWTPNRVSNAATKAADSALRVVLGTANKGASSVNIGAAVKKAHVKGPVFDAVVAAVAEGLSPAKVVLAANVAAEMVHVDNGDIWYDGLDDPNFPGSSPPDPPTNLPGSTGQSIDKQAAGSKSSTSAQKGGREGAKKGSTAEAKSSTVKADGNGDTLADIIASRSRSTRRSRDRHNRQPLGSYHD